MMESAVEFVKWALAILAGLSTLALVVFGASGVALLMLCWALRKH
jgi:hypothetical protein